jgi:hypothetical protein
MMCGSMKDKLEKPPADEAPSPLAFVPKTPLGAKLLVLRQRIIAEGLPLLNREEIEKEIAHRRGENSK